MPGRGGRRGERADRRGARRAARRARRRRRRERACRRRPTRLYVDRVFTLRGIGTVATGTLWSGSIGEGDELRVEPGGLERARAQRPGARPRRSSAPRRASVSRSRCPASSGASCGAATRSSRPARFPSSYRLDVALEELAEIPAARARPPRHRRACRHASCASASATRSSGSQCRSSPRAATASCSARATTVGGGMVLDPAPPRHASAERLELVERGEVAATVYAPVRADSLRHLGDARRASSARATGSSRAAWLDELRAELERRIAARRPARPRRAAAGGAVGGRGRAAARPRAARREAVPPRRGRGARRARRGGGCARGELGLEPVKVDDRRSRATSRSREGSSVSATASRSPPRRTRRHAARSSPSARPPAGSPSRASATCSASAAHRAAAPRALRRRRTDPPRRRRARAAPPWDNRAMTPDEVTQLIDRYNDAWNAQDIDAVGVDAPSRHRLREPHRRRARRGRRGRARAHRRDLPQQPDTAVPRAQRSTPRATSP